MASVMQTVEYIFVDFLSWYFLRSYLKKIPVRIKEKSAILRIAARCATIEKTHHSEWFRSTVDCCPIVLYQFLILKLNDTDAVMIDDAVNTESHVFYIISFIFQIPIKFLSFRLDSEFREIRIFVFDP